MTTFSPAEVAYLENQRLARLATVGPNGAPHVVPVGFEVSEDGTALDVGGHDLVASKKWRDLVGNPNAAIVIDDLAAVDPWTPRGIEVRGTAELRPTGGSDKFGPDVRGQAWIRIVPRYITSWGIEGHAFSPAGRRRTRRVDP
ncbi:MAG: PPOX class F420-dependent oxidoreductase [Acidimicrobiales bacterium]|nr:PPOX class F420-dependent oxidoreductase [Acidimicrobiales bacterium]